MIGSVPFEVPAQFISRVATGDLVRYGALLKDANTGRIVAHLQETGALQKGLSFLSQSGSAVAGGPLAALTAPVQLLQGEALRRKMNLLEGMMQGLQTLSMANLAVSGLGIGVTVVTSLVVMRRLDALSAQVGTIADHVTEARREDALQLWRADVRSELQELNELKLRENVGHAAEQVARSARTLSNQGLEGLRTRASAAGISRMTETVAYLAALGGAQIQALCWLNESRAAQHRAQTVLEGWEMLSMSLPADKLGGGEDAAKFEALISNIRQMAASQPDLLGSLEARGLSVRSYVETAAQEEDEPLLLLSA